jgi:uncharacterized protein YtpQ (UPF0354 family)
MAIAQLGYNLQFVSGINCDGTNESPVIRMVVQHGKEALCYLKDRSFAQQCAARIGEVTGLSVEIKDLPQGNDKFYYLTANKGNYKANKKLAEDLNNSHAQQLTSELFGANPGQLLYMFPEKTK